MENRNQRPEEAAEKLLDTAKAEVSTASNTYFEIRQGLNALSHDVAEHWRASDYPPDMQREREQFRHAHLHAMKALGKIAAVIDHADHDRLKDAEARELLLELPKLIADLVRCAARMAQTAPVYPIDFSGAYTYRACQLADRWARHRSGQR